MHLLFLFHNISQYIHIYIIYMYIYIKLPLLLFFSKALSMCNQITKENTNKSAT